MTIELVYSNDNPQPAASKETVGPFFKNVVPLGDARSDKTDDARLWTPRDALLHVLNLIDSGELNPDAMVICFANTHDGTISTDYRHASPDVLSSIGMIEVIKRKLMPD